MILSVQVAKPQNVYKKCLILGVHHDKLIHTTREIDAAAKGYLTQLIKKGTFQAKIGQVLPLFQLNHTAYEQILLVGCGKAASLTLSDFQKIVITAVKALRTYHISDSVCYLGELAVDKLLLPAKIKLMTEAAYDGLYCFDVFRSEKETPFAIKSLTFHVPHSKDKACERALKQGEAIAQGVTLAKNLANTPSNVCTPQFLADQAMVLAKNHSAVSVSILNEKEMHKLGMGALLAVSQGSAEEAKLIILQYTGTNKKKAPVALVGKGVTFDTGGNSIKPADSMVGMKYDMCGAATVLGTLQAAAILKLPQNIIGIIPAVENMPGGSAYKPEDILTSLSGQTIEVISTDAEGRLALADALTYCERFKPDVVIDIATLTGAVVIALGMQATGLLANDESLAKDLLKAGMESNDRAWQLPLWPEYQELIKSPFADMANVGGRAAGVITAGCFLSRFAKSFRWAHLDVAGTAAVMGGMKERMATGRPVPMLMQYLINRGSK